MILNTRPTSRRSALAALASSALIPTLMLSATAAYRPHGDDTIYTLQRVYTRGEVDHYQIKIDLNAQGAGLNGTKKISIVMQLKEETRDSRPDGNGVLKDSFEEAGAQTGDNKFDVTNFLPAITQTRDRQSHVLASKSEGGSPEFAGAAEQYSRQLIAFYPDKPLKVGDNWELDYKDDKAAAPYKVSGKGTVIKIEKVGGVDTLRLKVVTDTSADTMDPDTKQKVTLTAHFEGTGNMDLKTGKIVAMSGKNTFTGGPFTAGDIDWKLKTADDTDAKKDAKKSAEKGNG